MFVLPLVIFESASKPTPVLPPVKLPPPREIDVDATMNDRPLKVKMVEEAVIEEVAKPRVPV